jgi:hypothetical protein
MIFDSDNIEVLMQRAVINDVSYIEVGPQDTVPGEEDIEIRKALGKKILHKNKNCHTVIIRAGCAISVFRNTRKAPPIQGTPCDGWFRHDNGFLLLWHSTQHPQVALPVALGETNYDNWEDYRSALIEWLRP